jgi:hypothetical protein
MAFLLKRIFPELKMSFPGSENEKTWYKTYKIFIVYPGKK